MNPIIRGSNDLPQGQQFNPQTRQQQYPQQNPYNQPGNQQPFPPNYQQNDQQYPQQNQYYPDGKQQYRPNYQQTDQMPYPPQNMDQGYNRPKGTWEATGPQMNDMQAHRDARYELPNQLKQTISVFKTQMNLYSKRKGIYILLLLAFAIPFAFNFLKERVYFGNFAEMNGNGIMGFLLCWLPLFLAFFTAFFCSKLMPSEISERTAYMNMALPMSRASFCLGKYLASVVITLGIVVFSYGMAMFTASSNYSFFDEDRLSQSFLFMILAVLVYTSFSFAMGCLLKRGSALLSLLTMALILPGIQLYLFTEGHIGSTALTMFPNLIPDMTCLTLGSYLSTSPIGLLNLFTRGGKNAFDISQMDMTLTAILALVWTVAFLLIGIYKVSRREM